MKTTKEQRMAVATEIWAQIRATVSPFVYMSWGVSRKVADEYEGRPALSLRVSGVYHKGWAVISYDYGSDTYKVDLISIRGVVKKHFDDVYCDMLADLLDRHIERGYGSSEEYHKAAMADSQKKFNRYEPSAK